MTFITIYVSCSGRHNVGKSDVNILQHLKVRKSGRWSGASTEIF